MLRHGAKISARAPTKGHVQTGARALAPCLGTKSERDLSRHGSCILFKYIHTNENKCLASP